MSGLLRHPRVQLLLRLLLGAFFVFASLDKIASPAAFAKIVYQWQVIGPVPSNLVAVTLPWIELVAGLLLIAGVWKRESALVIALMLVVFIVAAGSVHGPRHRRGELRLRLPGEGGSADGLAPRLDEGRGLVPRQSQPGSPGRFPGPRARRAAGKAPAPTPKPTGNGCFALRIHSGERSGGQGARRSAPCSGRR